MSDSYLSRHLIIGKLVLFKKVCYVNGRAYVFLDKRLCVFGGWLKHSHVMVATAYDKYHCSVECLLDNQVVWVRFEDLEVAGEPE